MFHKFALLVLVVCVGCGDKGTEPESHPLVGNWRLVNSDFQGLRRAMVDYTSRTGTNVTVDESFVHVASMRFNDDFTWSDDQGESGTWSTDSGDRLTITDSEGVKLTMSYSIQGNSLTLSFTGSDFIQSGANSLEIAFLQQILSGHENTVLVRFVLERSS